MLLHVTVALVGVATLNLALPAPLISASLSVGSVTIYSAQYKRVLTTLNLCLCRWCEEKLRYCSVCVGFLYTFTLRVPSSRRHTSVSRKGSWPLSSPSLVNLMLGSMLLVWLVNSSIYSVFITTNVSSTYLYQTRGRWGAEVKACFSKFSI